jgi:hypothetical protein
MSLTRPESEAVDQPTDALGQLLDLEHFRARVLQDALDQATIGHWLKRHEALSASLPRPGDFTGRASSDELKAREADVRRALAAIERHVYLLQHTYREAGPEVVEAVRSWE